MPKVKLNGVEIYYEDHGREQAPVVILSPLLFMDTTAFDPMIQALVKDFRVVTYDHRGQGRSSRPGRKSDLETSTQDAIQLIEHLKIEPCHFVGNCLGAYVGLNLACAHGELLKSVTLMGASAEAEAPDILKEIDLFLETMKKYGASSGIESFTKTHFGQSFRRSRDPKIVKLRSQIMDHFCRLTPEEIENARQVFHHRTLSQEELSKMTMPVLVLAGNEDLPANIASYKRLAENLLNVNYKTIPGAGYALVVEKPAIVTELVRNHIERAERTFLAQAASSKTSKSRRLRL